MQWNQPGEEKYKRCHLISKVYVTVEKSALVEVTSLKSPSTQKCLLLIVSSLECLCFTVQNNICAGFNARRLFSHSSPEGGESLCAHFKFEFNTFTYSHVFVTSQLVWRTLVVQYVTYTSVMWKLEVFSAHQLRMDCSVKQEKLHFHKFWIKEREKLLFQSECFYVLKHVWRGSSGKVSLTLGRRVNTVIS